MTYQDIAQRISAIEELLQQLTQKKPSLLRRLVNWCKPFIIPFILGMLVGGIAVPIALQGKAANFSQQQAALGGAVIPFPSVSPSPSLSALPLIDSMQEPSGCTSTSTSEESSPSNPQADAGQTTSIRFYRTLRRLMR